MTFQIRNINGHLNEFYSSSSIFVPNKYNVYIEGEYVTEAINNLDSIINNLSEDYDFDKKNYDYWKTNHVSSVISQVPSSDDDRFGDTDFNLIGNQTSAKYHRVNFLWTCKSINIPLTQIVQDEVENKQLSLHPFKNLKYSIITDYAASQIAVSMTLQEQRGIVWNQFFNELGNVFYDPKLLTARDSIGKMKIVVDVINSRDTDNSSEFESLAKFEYNNAILVKREEFGLSHDTKEGMDFGISFRVPNPFQSSFNHNEYGLADRLNDNKHVTGINYNANSYESDIPSFVKDYEDFISDDSEANRLGDA